MLAKSYLERIIQNCQQALKQLDQENKRKVVGLIDCIEDDAEAAKWILINEIKEEEGRF
jgi:hypothetical protein